jgi:HSP20 family protein
MALIRWEPFREFETLQRQMNRLFDEIRPTSRQSEAAIAFIPPAEMEENPDSIQLRMELPGINPEDLNVQVSPDAVSISGERRTEVKAEERGVIRTEFSYGRFQRLIPLPTRVDIDKVQAEYKNGILRLTLPKAEEEKNKVVKVNVGEISGSQGQQSGRS